MTRNEILTRIVLANGGIVTNSDNENLLLNDWLLAVSSFARYFTTFDSVAQTYISLSSPVTLSGDFEIEVDVVMSNTTSDQMIFGSTLGTNNCAFISSGNLIIRDNSSTSVQAALPANFNNKINRLKFKKESGTVTVIINDNTVTSGAFGSLVNIDRLGIRQTSSFPFNGIISDLKIEDNGTLISRHANRPAVYASRSDC